MQHSPPVIRNVPAVTRAVQILRYLEHAPDPVGVTAIAAALDIIPSTCLHILRALNAENLVEFDAETKRYALGSGVLSFSESYLAKNDLHRIAVRQLEAVAQQHHVTTVAIKRVSDDRLCVAAVVGGGDAFSVRMTAGATFNAWSSASGRCIAAHSRAREEQMKSRFARLRWQSAPSYATWRKEVAAVIEQGYAVDPGNYILGVTVVSAPVLNAADAVTHCLAAVGFKEQLQGDALHGLGDDLAERARRLSARSSQAGGNGRGRG